jgi:uncharacterized damage-inducible protein DinB
MASEELFMDQDQRDDLLKMIDRVHQRTRRVSSCILAEHLEHSFAEGRFTLGDLVRHLAAINRYMFIETISGRPSSYPGHKRELADGLDTVLNYQQRLHAEGMELLKELPLERFSEKCVTPDNGSIAVWKWLRAMTEHEAHHRGQIYLLLGMLGVSTPPLYGLTSEEVLSRSRRP